MAAIDVILGRGMDILEKHFGMAEVYVAEFESKLPELLGCPFRRDVLTRLRAWVRLAPTASKQRRLGVSGTGT